MFIERKLNKDRKKDKIDKDGVKDMHDHIVKMIPEGGALPEPIIEEKRRREDRPVGDGTRMRKTFEIERFIGICNVPRSE